MGRQEDCTAKKGRWVFVTKEMGQMAETTVNEGCDGHASDLGCLGRPSGWRL